MDGPKKDNTTEIENEYRNMIAFLKRSKFSSDLGLRKTAKRTMSWLMK